MLTIHAVSIKKHMLKIFVVIIQISALAFSDICVIVQSRRPGLTAEVLFKE